MKITTFNTTIKQFTIDTFWDNGLEPIIWWGQTVKPKYMFVFINPTKRNLWTDPSWTGPRYPRIGYTSLWEFFHEANLINTQRLEAIKNHTSLWTPQFTAEFYSYLSKQSYYLTNVVKRAWHDATLPSSHMIKAYIPLLLQEIEIIQPEHIILFWKIPMSVFLPWSLALKECYTHFKETWSIWSQAHKKYTLIPCYFPVWLWRRNKPMAIEILRHLQYL